MRPSQPRSAASTIRAIRWATNGPKMRRPSPLPIVIPTRSSVLQRLMWWLMPGH